MPQHTVDYLKRHIPLPAEVTEDDALIEGYSKAAEGWVQSYLRRDLDAEFPDEWPFSCRQALLVIVAEFYDFRGSAGAIGLEADPRVTSLLGPFRSLD